MMIVFAIIVSPAALVKIGQINTAILVNKIRVAKTIAHERQQENVAGFINHVECLIDILIIFATPIIPVVIPVAIIAISAVVVAVIVPGKSERAQRHNGNSNHRKQTGLD